MPDLNPSVGKATAGARRTKGQSQRDSAGIESAHTLQPSSVIWTDELPTRTSALRTRLQFTVEDDREEDNGRASERSIYAGPRHLEPITIAGEEATITANRITPTLEPRKDDTTQATLIPQPAPVTQTTGMITPRFRPAPSPPQPPASKRLHSSTAGGYRGSGRGRSLSPVEVDRALQNAIPVFPMDRSHARPPQTPAVQPAPQARTQRGVQSGGTLEYVEPEVRRRRGRSRSATPSLVGSPIDLRFPQREEREEDGQVVMLTEAQLQQFLRLYGQNVSRNALQSHLLLIQDNSFAAAPPGPTHAHLAVPNHVEVNTHALRSRVTPSATQIEPTTVTTLAGTGLLAQSTTVMDPGVLVQESSASPTEMRPTRTLHGRPPSIGRQLSAADKVFPHKVKRVLEAGMLEYIPLDVLTDDACHRAAREPPAPESSFVIANGKLRLPNACFDVSKEARLQFEEWVGASENLVAAMQKHLRADGDEGSGGPIALEIAASFEILEEFT